MIPGPPADPLSVPAGNETVEPMTGMICKPLPFARLSWYVCLVTDRVERVGNTVRRPMNYWSPAVHDLLRYLERIDFPAPRLLRAEHGVETLTWIDGESGPDAWASGPASRAQAVGPAPALLP